MKRIMYLILIMLVMLLSINLFSGCMTSRSKMISDKNTPIECKYFLEYLYSSQKGKAELVGLMFTWCKKVTDHERCSKINKDIYSKEYIDCRRGL